MKRILILLLVLCSLKTMAQYPVTSISITLPPQPKPNTGDWAMPFVITAQAKLVNGQVPGYLTESRILVTIKKGGTKFCGSYTQTTAPVSMFNSPVKTWSGGVAIGLIGSNCELPPGSYELCVQFFSNNPAVSVAMPYSTEVCKTFTIAEPQKITYSPPQNVMPVDGKVFTKQEANLPIMFRWTPVLPKPKEDVIYKVRLYEVAKGTSKAQAIKSGSPVETIEVKNITQTSFKLAPRCNNCEWVWNVEAIATERVQGAEPKIYGKSEATGFGINTGNSNRTASECSSSCYSLDFNYNQNFFHISNDTTINPPCGAEGIFLFNTSCERDNPSNQTLLRTVFTDMIGNIIADPKPIGFWPNQTIHYRAIFTFGFPPEGQDPEVVCRTITVAVNTCGTCSCITVNNKDISCQGTTDNGQPQYFFHDSISNNCPVPILSWSITSPNCDVSDFNPQSFSGTNTITGAIRIINATANPVTLVYQFTDAGGISCTFTRTLTLPDCITPPSCSCGSWTDVSIQTTSDTGSPQTITKNCTDTFSIPKGAPFTISPAYSCTGTNCNVSYRYDVFTSTGFQLYNNALASSILFSEMDQCTDVYRIVIKPTCGTQTCMPCTIYLKRDCPPPCTCGVWGDAKLTYTFLGGVYNNVPVSCGKGVTVNCNKQVTINSADFTCNGQCTSVISVKIYKPSGAYLMGSIGLPIVFTPTILTGGPYKIVLEGTCDGNTCSSCTFYVTPKCDPCTCDTWIPVTYKNLSNNSQGTKDCGGELQVNQGETYSFSTASSCISQGTTCAQTASYSIYLNGNLVIGPRHGFTINRFKFETCGNYEIRFNGSCDGSQCQCILKVKVDCCAGKKIKMLTNDNIDITQSTNCVQPDKYLFKLVPDLPTNSIASYQLVTLSNNVIISQGSYSTGGKWLTIPFFSCDASQFKVIINWNGGSCSDTIVKFICQSACCDYITPMATQVKSLSGPPGSQVLDFESKFDMPPGAPVKWNKIKIQILEVRVGNSPTILANLSQLQISAPFGLLSTLTNSNAIIQGDAIWFDASLLASNMPITAPNQFVIKGKLINLLNFTGGASSVKLKLRYTFYKDNGTCAETICEKTIDY